MPFTPRGEAPDVGVPAALAARMSVGEQHEWLTSFLRRHPVSRRTALRGGSGVLAAMGLAAAPWTLSACAQAARAPVAVVGRHLAFGADPQRQMAMAGELTAFFHHCAFATSESHASDAGVRAAVAPLFDEFSVDLALQGHNHQYERTNPIRRGRSAVQAPDGATVRPETDGTTYVCVGSGGRPRYAWQPNETDRFRGNTGPDSGVEVASYLALGEDEKAPDRADWSQARYLDYAYVTVDVTPPPASGGVTRMTLRAVTDTGVEIDRVSLERRRA